MSSPHRHLPRAVIIGTPGALAPHIPTIAPEANGTRSDEGTAPETEGETTHDELPTYTAGTTPMDMILAQFDRVVLDDSNRFPMVVVDPEELRVMCAVVAQGIDSHLEAFTSSEFTRSTALGHPRLQCRISRADFPVLIRRLREMADEGDDAAERLVGVILESLGIEEV